MAVPRPMGTARTTAMAVDSMVPRMNGRRPYLPWDGSQTFSKIQETPSVENAGLAWMTMATRNQTASAPNSSATTPSIPR